MLKNKIYWGISYRESMRDEYKNDITLQINESDLDLLKREFDCLKKHKYKIMNLDYYFGRAFIEETIDICEDILKTYKTKSIVPYVLFKPTQYLCHIDGIPLLNGDSFYQIR